MEKEPTQIQTFFITINTFFVVVFSFNIKAEATKWETPSKAENISKANIEQHFNLHSF